MYKAGEACANCPTGYTCDDDLCAKEVLPPKTTEAPPTSNPTTEVPTLNPTTEVPTPNPTTEVPTPNPTSEVPTLNPTTSLPTGPVCRCGVERTNRIVGGAEVNPVRFK